MSRENEKLLSIAESIREAAENLVEDAKNGTECIDVINEIGFQLSEFRMEYEERDTKGEVN